MAQYTITEEQIKSIAEGGGKKKIKEMFPEVFETKLEVGKWYKSDTLLGCYKGNGLCYGFYKESYGNNWHMTNSNRYEEATPEEVEAALKSFLQKGLLLY